MLERLESAIKKKDVETINEYIVHHTELNNDFYNEILINPEYYDILLTNPDIIKNNYYTKKEQKYLESINSLKDIIPYFRENIRTNIEKYYNDNLEFTSEFVDMLLFDGVLAKLDIGDNIEKYFKLSDKQLTILYIFTDYSLNKFIKNKQNKKEFIEKCVDESGKFTSFFINSLYESEYIYMLLNKNFIEYRTYLSSEQQFTISLLEKYSIKGNNVCFNKFRHLININGGLKNDILMMLISKQNQFAIENIFKIDTMKFIEDNISYQQILDVLTLNYDVNSFIKILSDETRRVDLINYYNFLSFKLRQREKNSRNLLLKLASAMNYSPELFNKNVDELSSEDAFILIQQLYGINYSKNINLTEKDKFCIEMFGFDYRTMMHILKYHLNEEDINLIIKKIETKLKILYSSKSLSNYKEIYMLELELQKIHITSLYILCVNNILNGELTIMPNVVNNVQLKLWTLNIEETIRRIYELDTMLTLTDLNSIKNDSNKSKIMKVYETENGEKIEYFDFSNCEYALLVHSDSSVERLFDVKRNYVRQHLCLSQISDLGNKGYFKVGIVYGYSSIKEGEYLANSIDNVGSNDFLSVESVSDYNFLNSKKYIQREFKNGSKVNKNSISETNIINSGETLPSCVIMRGETPTKEEINAAKKLGELLGLDTIAPLVKPQDIYTQVYGINKIYLDNSVYNPNYINLSLDKLREEYCQELGITSDFQYKSFQENIETYNNSRKKLDNQKKLYGMHEIEKRDIGIPQRIQVARINGYDIIVKDVFTPDRESEIKNAYAGISAYRIQQLINPEGAVKVELKEIELEKNETKELCYFSYKIANTEDFRFLDMKKNKDKKIHKLSEGEIICFLRELIVDYLIFNTSNKGENFLYDEVKRDYIYGINKENSLINISYNNSIEVSNIYLKVFEYIKENINDNFLAVILNVYEDIINKIESLTDEEYLSLFNEYISTLENEIAKNNIREGLINRKNNIRKSINNLLNEQFNISLANEMTNGNVL